MSDLSIGLITAVANVSSTGANLLGTGFFVSENKVATTAHVCGLEDKELHITIKDTIVGGYQDTTDNSAKFIKARIFSYDPIRDISILEINGNVSGIFHNLISTDYLQTGCPLLTLGYPHADHGRMVATQQNTSLGAKILLGNSGVKSKHIVLNIQTRPGQSGSPVLDPARNSVVGMILGGYVPNIGTSIDLGGIDPQTLHQTTHAISAEYIKDMM